MNIKKFYFQIYHSFGPVYRLIYKKGKWLYEVELELEPIYLERYIRATPSQYKHNEIFPQVNSIKKIYMMGCAGKSMCILMISFLNQKEFAKHPKISRLCVNACCT